MRREIKDWRKNKLFMKISILITIFSIVILLAGCVDEEDKPDEIKLDEMHLLHQDSTMLNFECSDCHSIDPDGDVILRDGDLYYIGELDDEDFRVDVNREDICINCHGTFPTSLMDESYKDLDCTSSSCHSDFSDRMSEATYLNTDVMTADDCLTCHGGDNVFYNTSAIHED